ncbi:hypothetical protein CBR_g49602 [Chara braunii]|uniref:Uncharacterized protein n=1 Tax=Chara braunii TaxID=69332 RepID=A0A388M5D6_CHABU|nr:hypothetical protein CBR_g49602 [Chara braunii]|eukprot:GBG89750.1 hypothetical protein CBR_g49602 [Chara braunii]
MKELRDLRASRKADKEILINLRAEIGSLRKEKEQSVEETRLWMNEVLRPGNKRGNIVISTPEGDDRQRSTLRVMESPSMIREELRKMKDMEYCTLREVEALKKRRADAEERRLEAEAKKKEAEDEVA